jgi:hypothetical protein
MQRSSTKLRNVAEQEQLDLLSERKKIISAPVDLARIPGLRNTHKALEYACSLADVAPKEICPLMDCDKTVWSRICSGEFDLDGRDIPKFNKVIGNSAYLLYLNHIDGWDLASMRKAQDDKDRRIAELESKLAAKELEVQTIVNFHKATR